MKALQFDRTGDLAALELVDMPDPLPAADEVRVEIRAAGLNPSDVKNVLGRFPIPPCPGYRAATSPEWWWRDRRPCSARRSGAPGGSRDSSATVATRSSLTLPAAGVALKPESLSFAQAASCRVPYSTAWDAPATQPGQGRHPAPGNRRQRRGRQGRAGAGQGPGGRSDRRGAARGATPGAGSAGHRRAAAGRAGRTGGTGGRDLPGGAEVIFDTTGFWLEAAVPALAAFGRLAIIAAPADGHVRLPALNLYRRGGSVVGINSLLYGVETCAGFLDAFGKLFDQAPPAAAGRAAGSPAGAGR